VITFTLKPKGVVELAQRPDVDQVVADLAASCWVDTFVEYMTGTMPAGVSVRDRFEPSAFTTYNLQARNHWYQRLQMRRIGHLVPFFSPRAVNWARLATALTKPSAGNIQGALRDLARQTMPHMRDMISKPGIGWRIKVSGKRKVKVTLSYPGARILNRKPEFAEEFRDLDRGGTAMRMRTRARFLFKHRMAALCRNGGMLSQAKAAA